MIAVASDLSPTAAEALRYALRFGAEAVSLLHVHDVSRPEPYEITLDAAFRASNEGTTREFVERALDRAVGDTGVVAEWRSALRPAEAVRAYAEEVDAEMVVVGTHGLTGFRRAVVGSVAEAIARSAPCPVLAVPLDEASPWSRRPTRRVLCAVDLSPAASLVADAAADVADWLGAEAPVMLHVEDGLAVAALREVAVGPRELETVEGVYARLADRFGTVETADGPAATVVVGRADEEDADLIVVGSGQRRGAARALGSVAGKVLRTARRPVLVVPTHPHPLSPMRRSALASPTDAAHHFGSAAGISAKASSMAPVGASRS